MTTEEEFRRQRLIDLANGLGRGGVARIAEKIGVDATYVSRMKSAPESKQHRPITGDMVLSIEKAFPGWLSPSPDTHSASKTAESASAHSAVEKVANAPFEADPVLQSPLVVAAIRLSRSPQVNEQTKAAATLILQSLIHS